MIRVQFFAEAWLTGTDTRIPNRAFIAARRSKKLGREALAALVRAWAYAEDSKREPPSLETVVKCIGRVERGDVRSPGDFYTAAFSAVLEVPAVELFGTEAPAAAASAGFAVTSHQFVPLFIGPAEVQELVAGGRYERVELGLTHAHAAPVDHPEATGTAYLLDWGILLLHLSQPLTPAGVAALAVWRNRQHADALGHDALHPYLSAALGRHSPPPKYVLSAYWVDRPLWTGDDLLATARLMCVPSVLLDRLQDDDAVLLARAEVAERAHLRNGFTHPDITEFGVPGVAVGCASWSGVVYAPLAPSRALHPHELVNLEVVTQSLWSYTAHLLDAATRGDDLTLSPRFGWRFLRTWRARLLTAHATETGQVRMMRDAILTTCGLLDRLDETQDLLRDPN